MAHADTTDNAATRLKELSAYFREHPVTGPTEGHAASVRTPAPLSLATLDHITASVREVEQHTRAVNPDAGPLPPRVHDAYTWMHENIESAPEEDRRRAEVIEYRQWMEHTIRVGDWRKAIRPQRCPWCRTYGLMWIDEWQRALCTNTECVDSDGFSNKATLSQLAHQHVMSRKNLRPVSAT